MKNSQKDPQVFKDQSSSKKRHPQSNRGQTGIENKESTNEFQDDEDLDEDTLYNPQDYIERKHPSTTKSSYIDPDDEIEQENWKQKNKSRDSHKDYDSVQGHRNNSKHDLDSK